MRVLFAVAVYGYRQRPGPDPAPGKNRPAGHEGGPISGRGCPRDNVPEGKRGYACRLRKIDYINGHNR